MAMKFKEVLFFFKLEGQNHYGTKLEADEEDLCYSCLVGWVFYICLHSYYVHIPTLDTYIYAFNVYASHHVLYLSESTHLCTHFIK